METKTEKIDEKEQARRNELFHRLQDEAGVAELKPCPFCGTDRPYRIKNPKVPGLIVGHASWCTFAVQCGKCHITGPEVEYDTKELNDKKIAAWAKKNKVNFRTAAELFCIILSMKKWNIRGGRTA